MRIWSKMTKLTMLVSQSKMFLIGEIKLWKLALTCKFWKMFLTGEIDRLK